ncbi:MAG: TIGR00730 family Rossman fold protein, partial [Candidatus Saccharimonadales bacterium]
MKLPTQKLPAESVLPDAYAHREISKGLVKSIRKVEEEMTNGFEFISGLKKAVSIFGGGRFTQENPHYAQAQELGAMLAKAGLTVVTGGGPGIMEAG